MGANLLHHRILETNNRRSATWIKCPRPELQLTYMIDIALTAEFMISLAVCDD